MRDERRLPLLDPTEMSAEQHAIYTDVVRGPRGQMIGPLRAAIHSPALATVWSNMGEFLRYNTSVPEALGELAIITTGRRWSSAVEWWAHTTAALRHGIDPAIVEAIRRCASPIFADRAQWEVYEYTRLLQQTGNVDGDLYAAMLARHGPVRLVELTALIGYYTMVAITLNAHELPLPEGAVSDLPDHAILVSLMPGLMATTAQSTEEAMA